MVVHRSRRSPINARSQFFCHVRAGLRAAFRGMRADLVCLVAGSLLSVSAHAEEAFTNITAEEIKKASPGTLLRIHPIPGGGLHDAKSYRILYRSRGPNGEPIAITGAVFIPDHPAPEHGRPIVGWGHPTSGIVHRCVPSLLPDISRVVPGLWDMMERGYIVAATDYQGPGDPSVQPFLIGEAEGRAVLDSVRAAQHISGADAQERFALWGHSQGGHAVLFAAQMAESYAPELQLVGVAAAAPATDLVKLFKADRHTRPGRTLTSMALWSWSKLYQLPLDHILESDARESFEELAHDCIETLYELAKIRVETQPLEQEKFLKGNPTELEPWATLMKKNSVGQVRMGIPTFIAQGTDDPVVDPEITKEFVRRLCVNDTKVDLFTLDGTGHEFAAYDSALTAVAWIAGRFQGKSAPDDCGSPDIARPTLGLPDQTAGIRPDAP